MIEPLVVSLKEIDGKPATTLRRKSGALVARIYDEEYLRLFQWAAVSASGFPVHLPDKAAG